jgi:hypothetical protein
VADDPNGRAGAVTGAVAASLPIDDLAGAPPVGDPRIRLKPRHVHGRTVRPLTGPGGVQAWKIVIPTSQSTPARRTHDGFEWLYVLSGRMRSVLAEQDLLSIFGRPGERMLMRASAGADAADPYPDPHLG